jgi:hypothetical protein
MRVLHVLSALCASALLVVTVQAQENQAQQNQAQENPPAASSAKSAPAQGNDHAVEGTVVSMTEHTLVLRTDDEKYHLFTYDPNTVHTGTVKPGAHVRVESSAPDESGTQVAKNVAVIETGSNAAPAAPAVMVAQPNPPPPQVNKTSKQIEYEARRWHVGGKIGMGLSPELVMLGPQIQFGPFFTPHLLFRPNAEFGFGELTDMYAINAEGMYRFGTTFYGRWAPYLGMGPSFNFVNQSASSGTVSFSNFNYKTGFNVFVGAQNHKTFVEVKTALWSGKAPVFRMFIGYNF